MRLFGADGREDRCAVGADGREDRWAGGADGREDRWAGGADGREDRWAGGASQDERIDGLSERLGRLEQEQARMNGMLETIRAGLSYRVERADAGDRVAEDAESYAPEE